MEKVVQYPCKLCGIGSPEYMRLFNEYLDLMRKTVNPPLIMLKGEKLVPLSKAQASSIVRYKKKSKIRWDWMVIAFFVGWVCGILTIVNL